MNMQSVFTNVGPLLKRNSSTILTGLGVAGSVGSLIMGIKATPKAQRKLDQAWLDKNAVQTADQPEVSVTVVEVIKLVWLDYVPAVGLQVVSIACIVGAQSINMRKQAAVITAFGVAEAGFREYQERITAEAPTKDRKVRDDIAAQKIADNPVSQREVVVIGEGDQLFFDDYTGRYFMSTKQKVDRAVNDLNFRILNQEYSSLNEYYNQIGLPTISTGDEFGWTAEQPLELDFSTHMTEDDRPAIVITFVRNPLMNYWKGFQ